MKKEYIISTSLLIISLASLITLLIHIGIKYNNEPEVCNHGNEVNLEKTNFDFIESRKKDLILKLKEKSSRLPNDVWVMEIQENDRQFEFYGVKSTSNISWILNDNPVYKVIDLGLGVFNKTNKTAILIYKGSYIKIYPNHLSELNFIDGKWVLDYSRDLKTMKLVTKK